ncbi:MAG: hypothetical protein M1370_05035 [Bacteroidetes bacterium]|nr:hypothetical protein [Bacteroidota bacterium]
MANISRSRKRVKYQLRDEQQPNLLRETFPYTEVPRLRFDGRSVPMALPEHIWITDTTFRDGQQARPPYTVEQIVALYDLLHRLGGPEGVIRYSEFFLYSEKDRRAVEACRERNYTFPEVTGWIRASKEDFKLVKQMGIKETGILTSASDYHIFLKLRSNRRKVMESYLEVVSAALELGIRVRCHLEDLTRADFYGFVVPFAQRLMELSEQSGIQIKLRLADTLGYAVPHAEAELPRSVPKLVHGLIHDAGVPSECLEWHGHNDFHRTVVNAATAWLYGCCYVNGSLLGTGERTGNTPLEALIIDYIQLKGHQHGIDTRVITEIAEYYERELGHRIPDNYPFIGRDFNVTSAGIHIDGLSKDEEIYNIFNTGRLLGRPVGAVVTDKSGVAGLVYWLNNYLKLDHGLGLTKTMPGVLRINQWVQQQYEYGRVTAISPEEILEQARIHLSEWFGSAPPAEAAPAPAPAASRAEPPETVSVFPSAPEEGMVEWPGNPIGLSNIVTRTKSRTLTHDKTIDEKPGLAESLVGAAQAYIQEHPDLVTRLEAVIHGVRVRVFTNSQHLADFWGENWYSVEEWEAATGTRVTSQPRVRVYALAGVEGQAEAAYYSRSTNTIVFFNTAYYGQLKSWVLGAVGRVLAEESGIHSIHGACVEKEDNGILYIAPTGTGKSTSSYGLMCYPNSRFHSDDWVYIRYAYRSRDGRLVAPVSVVNGGQEVARGFQCFKWLESNRRGTVRGIGLRNEEIAVPAEDLDLAEPPQAYAYISEKVFYLRANLAESFPEVAYQILHSNLENVPDVTPSFIFDNPELVSSMVMAWMTSSNPKIRDFFREKSLDEVTTLASRLVAFDNARAMLDISKVFDKVVVNPMEPVRLTHTFLLRRNPDSATVIEALPIDGFMGRLLVGETPGGKREIAYNAYRAVDDTAEQHFVQLMERRAAESRRSLYDMYLEREWAPETLREEFELFRMLFRSTRCYDLNTILLKDPNIADKMEAVARTIRLIAAVVEKHPPRSVYTIANYNDLLQGTSTAPVVP